MTTIGKILVVLHLVLSILFMAFAGAVFTAQTNWKSAEKATQAKFQTAESAVKLKQAVICSDPEIAIVSLGYGPDAGCPVLRGPPAMETLLKGRCLGFRCALEAEDSSQKQCGSDFRKSD